MNLLEAIHLILVKFGIQNLQAMLKKRYKGISIPHLILQGNQFFIKIGNFQKFAITYECIEIST